MEFTCKEAVRALSTRSAAACSRQSTKTPAETHAPGASPIHTHLLDAGDVCDQHGVGGASALAVGQEQQPQQHRLLVEAVEHLLREGVGVGDVLMEFVSAEDARIVHALVERAFKRGAAG